MDTLTQTLPRLDPHLVYGIDAVVSSAMGMALMFAAAPLTQLAGWNVPAGFLQIIGLLLLPWAALNAWTARTAHPPRSVVRGIIAGDIAWVVGSVLLILVHLSDLDPAGLVLAGQGVAVAGVLTLKLAGARSLV